MSDVDEKAEQEISDLVDAVNGLFAGKPASICLMAPSDLLAEFLAHEPEKAPEGLRLFVQNVIGEFRHARRIYESSNPSG